MRVGRLEKMLRGFEGVGVGVGIGIGVEGVYGVYGVVGVLSWEGRGW